MTSEKPRAGYNHSEAHEVTQELDAYGVWVKSEPQTISESIPDISGMLNFPDEDEAPSASKTYGTISLESRDAEQQDFIHIEMLEKGNGTSINDKSTSGISGDDKAVNPRASNDELFEDLSEHSAIEDFLAPVPSLDSGAPESRDTGLSENEAPALAVPDTPPPEPAEEAHPVAFMQALDAEGGLQLLRNILEELTLIRQEVSALKALVIPRETAAATLESQKGDGAEDEDNDEKVTITGDELTNIFHTIPHIPPTVPIALTSIHTTPFAQGIEDPGTDKEPPKTEYGAFIGFEESGQFQDAGTACDTAPDTLEILQEDTREGSRLDDTSPDLVLRDTYDETLADEAPGNTRLKDAEGNEDLPQVSPDEDGREKDASPDDLLPANSADSAIEDFLIDELFIENGSLKDIPIEWNPEDEAEMDDAFAMIESLIGPEDTEAQNKAGNSDDEEPPDDTPPFDGIDQGSSGTGFPDLPEEEPKPQEPSAFSTETSAHRPFNLKEEIKNVLMFMDQLLESLPEDKIGEFAESSYFDTYKKLFNELGIA